MFNAGSELLHGEVEAIVVLKNLIELWEAVQVWLLEFLGDLELATDGADIGERIGFEYDGFFGGGFCLFYELSVPFFKDFKRFVFFIDHLIINNSEERSLPHGLYI